MYKNHYQYGKSVDLLDIHDKEALKTWQTVGSLKKAYDKSVKGYVWITDQNSKWTHPKDRKQTLGLV